MKTEFNNKLEIDVIVLDDEVDLCFMMQAILKSSGFSVKGLTNAANLDSFLEEYSPKVLVLDLQLQKFNGAEICEKLIAGNVIPTAKILLISASYNGLEKAHRCGADAFLEKPFGIKEFETKVMSLMQETEPVVEA
jgi:DNA-binding response OmpR family regulator